VCIEVKSSFFIYFLFTYFIITILSLFFFN